MIPVPPQLLTPLAKGLAIVAIAAALYGLGQWHGREAIQQRWDASVTVQTGEAMSVMIDQARNQADAQVRYVEVQGKELVRTKVVTKEVVKYVESSAQQCVLSPEFEWTYDTIVSLLDTTEDGLPAANRPTRTLDESARAQVTDATVLLAVTDLVTQYRDLWLAYRALRDAWRSDYALASEGR